MALQDDVRNLSSNPTLGELEADALRLIAFSAETRILRAGNTLFHRGDVADGGYVVLSGSIEVDNGVDPPTIVRSPTLIGDMALLVETTRPCSAVAKEPSSVLKITRTLFHRVLSEHPRSAERLRRVFGSRLLTLRDELAAFRQELG